MSFQPEYRGYDVVRKTTCIDEIPPGHFGFTVPWAFSGSYVVSPKRGGTFCIPIGRDSSGRLWVGSPALHALTCGQRR